MQIQKKVIANLPKCYAICQLDVDGQRSFLVATEKLGDCQRFTLDGEYLETIWSEPGGIMTMVQIPQGNGAFLSTQRFFSPNDSKEAKLVLAEPVDAGGAAVKNLEEPHTWRIRVLTELPFLHRFDILSVGARRYLIACCLKSGHDYKEDWTHPGRVYVTELPEDLGPYGADNPLPLTVLREGLTKNHGYGRCVMPDGGPGSLIAAENGIFRIAPPRVAGGEWSVEQLTSEPASDCTEIDFDGNGLKEILVFAPFHGEVLTILKPGAAGYETVYRHAEPLEFLHAIWSGELLGEPTAVIGYRRGRRELLAVRYDKAKGDYALEVIDSDRGPTNVSVFEYGGAPVVIATNRETDEVALYTLSR